MGRRDNLEARAEMRLSDGELAILDTPVLVQLLVLLDGARKFSM